MTRRGWRTASALLLLAVAAPLCIGLVLKAALAPEPGEWSVPLRYGPLKIEASVPTLIRLATTPWVGPWLDGRTFKTRANRLQLSWSAGHQSLSAHCAPCSLRAPGLGGEALVLQALQVTARRQGDQLSGDVKAGRLQAAWQGRLSATGLQVQLQLPDTPIADGYALFGGAIPELSSDALRIAGSFSLTATLQLPGGDVGVTPQVRGFAVSGLGTEAFANMRSACSAIAAPLRSDSWLARAVIAAEDQRFFEHPGYDLVEITAALRRNQAAEATTSRGGSTLSQQLAKLLVTGGERSPVRKLRELLYAVEMEQTLGKPRILQLYLSHAPWGATLCGADAASRRYFGRAPDQLDAAQAAWLAAMLHNAALEARRWRASGQIDQARARWVLQGIRPLSRRQLAKAMNTLDNPLWKAPASPMAELPVPS